MPSGPSSSWSPGSTLTRLRGEFWRYSREYDLRTARSSAEAAAVTDHVLAGGGTVAMFVADSWLPDEDVRAAFDRWRVAVPTARRVIAAPVERFIADARVMQAEMAKGTFDSYLLIPQGPRDEEFHDAVTDLLSDWGSTVADPEAIVARVIAASQDALVVGIRDFLDRMGLPNRVYHPDSEMGRHAIAEAPPGAEPPLVWLVQRTPVSVRSVRDVAASVRLHQRGLVLRCRGPCGRGRARPGSQPPCTARRRA